MKEEIRRPLDHMLQGLAYWMAFSGEKNSLKIVESDVVSTAIDLLNILLPKDYYVVREVTRCELNILVGQQRVDLGIKHNGSIVCLIEFKLADATNGGYKKDVVKLEKIKRKDENIDCLVVILYRKSCKVNSPKELVEEDGKAIRRKITVKDIPVRVRRVCNSFSSKTNDNSKKTICLEII